MLRTRLIVWLFVGCNLVAFGQMNMAPGAMETQDELPPEQLPVPQKLTGIGNAHMQITATPEAQMWFDQGLNLLHDFWDYESGRAFEQSIRVDPMCAMCYWGLYAAESFYHSTAQGYAARALEQAVNLSRKHRPRSRAIRQKRDPGGLGRGSRVRCAAKFLKSNVSERERLFIEAVAAAKKGSHSDASAGLRTLVKQYPADTQLQLFLAGIVDEKEKVTILESVLKSRPDDSAANHYYIHALESSEHPEQALHSAEILASLAPASGHMVHMPGHIFFRIGDYERAERAFAASMQVDERYMQEQRVGPDNDWNYVHNLMYAIANLMEEGKLKQADTLSLKLTRARGKLATTLYTYSTRDAITRLDPQLPVALRAGDWARVIALLRVGTTPERRPHLEFLARQLATFASGMQAIEQQNLAVADESSLRFDAELWRISSHAKKQREGEGAEMNNMKHDSASSGKPKLEVLPDALLQPLVSSLSIMSLELRGALLTAQGKRPEAKDLFEKAAQEEKALGYHEPPNYIRPVGETAGAAMLAAGDWTEAKAAYEQALQERPRSGFALYGVGMACEKAGDVAAAEKQFGAFLAAWKNADRDLAQVRHAHEYLAVHSG